jgi:hypothetical protein
MTWGNRPQVLVYDETGMLISAQPLIYPRRKHLKTIIVSIAAAAFLLAVGASFQVGRAVQYATIQADTAAHENEPLSAIALTMCGRLAGFIVVDKAGVPRGLPHTATEADLEAAMKGVPDSHTLMAEAPCQHSPTT